MEDNTVTLRYRDTMKQERIPADKIVKVMIKNLKYEFFDELLKLLII